MKEEKDIQEEEKEEVRPDSEGFTESDHRRFLPPGNEEFASELIEEVKVEIVEETASEEPEIDSEQPVVESTDEPKTSRAETEAPCTTDKSPWGIVSHTVSWLMVPMLMPVYGTILIFTLSILSLSSAATRLWFTAIVFGINVMLPVLVIILLKWFGIVSDPGLNVRKERSIPYIVCILCLLATAWFMYVKHAPAMFCLFYVGGAIGGLVNLLINFKWKISAHAAGVAGILALLIRISSDGFPQGNVMLWLLIWILLAGGTGSARLYLQRHTFWQVMAGYAVGFLSVYITTAFGV